jgi:hypothetical protein
MNEHEVSELLRQANVIEVADLPDPRESPEAQRLLASILESGSPTGPGRHETAFRRVVLTHRLALAVVTAFVLVGAIIAVAVFPGSSETSGGLSRISNHGTLGSFAHGGKGWRGPYILARFGDIVFFRVELPKDFVWPRGFHGSSTGYGDGKLKDGEVAVWMLDYTPFPTAKTPVLAWTGVDATDRTGGGTLLFVGGIAADGVAEMRLISSSGRVIAAAPVKRNVFHFEDVKGLGATGTKLIGVDPSGREVWSEPGY